MIELIVGVMTVTSISIISFMCGQFIGWIISEICIYIENKIKNKKKKRRIKLWELHVKQQER